MGAGLTRTRNPQTGTRCLGFFGPLAVLVVVEGDPEAVGVRGG